MESSIPNEQRIIQTKSYLFWIVQFSRNISENDNLYILETIKERNTCKLYV